jgi:deoxyribodipyrimidine photo-lyase
MPSTRPIIVWFRDDLRLSDHPALHAAARSGAPVICLYVLDETAGSPLGGAARWWLAQSLRSLAASLTTIGDALTLRKGPAARVIPELVRDSAILAARAGARRSAETVACAEGAAGRTGACERCP